VDVDAVLGWGADARPRIERLLRLYTNEPRVHLMEALLARQSTDATSAEQHLRAAIRLAPENDRAHAILSGLEWELGRRQEALAEIRTAIRLNPRVADYFDHLGEIQRAPQTPEGWRAAEQSYRRALDLDPVNQQAKFGLAVCRLRLGDPDGQMMLEALLRQDPYLSAPLLELGNLCTRQGRRREGADLLARYQAGIKENDTAKGLNLRMAMQPKNPEAYIEFGELQMRTGFSQKAIVVLRRALRLAPGNPRARRDLAEALADAGREGEIREILARP